jgi:2-polyprenyl-3-methyl-5-hydroxy-6-metoxy-1,4-benzoquinol methylase
LLSTGKHAAFTLSQAKQTGIWGFARQAGIGSVFVGGGLALIGGTLAYFVARRRDSKSSAKSSDEPDELDEPNELLDAATQRTLLRYAHAPLSDRFQVAGKLRWDPLTRLLAALPRGFGRVLDVGAGRGQFGLLLVELGVCDDLSGFDGDARKVAVAERAASGVGHFETRDLLDIPARNVDTVLLFDVLHYLPFAEQDELLRRASLSVPRGRILIRELDAASGARSFATRASEWVAGGLGLHRGRAGRHYRSAAEIVARVSALGFNCDVRGASRGTPFGNVLIVASRRPRA